MVPENIHTHPMEGQWKYWEGGGGGVSTAKFLSGKVWSLIEISRGREGSNQKTFHRGGMDVFWNHTIWIIFIILWINWKFCLKIFLLNQNTTQNILNFYRGSGGSEYQKIFKYYLAKLSTLTQGHYPFFSC